LKGRRRTIEKHGKGNPLEADAVQKTARWDGTPDKNGHDDQSNVRGLPRFFLVMSLDTRYVLDLQIAPSLEVDYDEVLLAIFDFVENRAQEPNLALDEVCAIMLDDDAILVKALGAAIFAAVFSGEIDNSHYNQFQQALKFIQEQLPDLQDWDGRPGSLSDRIQDVIHRFFIPTSGTSGSGPLTGTGDADNLEYERLLDDYSRMGYNVDDLKGALHSDQSTLVEAFRKFEKDVSYMNFLSGRLDDMNAPGLELDVRRLKGFLKDPSRIPDVEEGIDELEFKRRYNLLAAGLQASRTKGLSTDRRTHAPKGESVPSSDNSDEMRSDGTASEIPLSPPVPPGGHIYLVRELKPDYSLNVFIRAMEVGGRGLLICRTPHPNELRNRWAGSSAPGMFWLSRTPSNVPTLDPRNLDGIGDRIIGNLWKKLPPGVTGVVLFEGIEFLVSQTDFKSVLNLFQRVNEAVLNSSARLIVALDPETLDPRELKLLTREMVEL